MNPPPTDKLRAAAGAYQRISYRGPPLPQSLSARRRARPLWRQPAGWITVAAGVVMMVLVLQEPGDNSGSFGRQYVERQTPYQALELARRALQGGSESATAASGAAQNRGSLRLPKLPNRASGFAPQSAQPEASEVS